MPNEFEEASMSKETTGSGNPFPLDRFQELVGAAKKYNGPALPQNVGINPLYGRTPYGTCPSCGYCPHCGRGGQQFYPTWPGPSITWS